MNRALKSLQLRPGNPIRFTRTL